MNLLDGMVAVYVAYGAQRGRKRGLAEEAYRLLRVGVALLAGCGLYGLVSGLIGKVLSLGSDVSGPVGFVATMLGAWSLLRVVRARVVAWVTATYQPYAAVGGAIAGGVRNLILAVSAMITAHLAGRSGFLAESGLGKLIAMLVGP